MFNPETFNMIVHIKGLLIEKSPTEVVLEVNGIGYLINISLNTFSKLGNEKNIKLSDIQKIVRDIDPFDGAQEFLDWARSKFQVTIVSDTFYELAWPLVAKLGYPSIICHNMTVENDKITGYKLRQPNNKQKVIEALQSLKFKVFASGDSYNDINMLNTADLGIFFQAPEHIKEEYPHLLTASSHNELKNILEEHI